MDYIVDATFLIDLWREQGRQGPATAFLRRHEVSTFSVSWIAKAEFLRGAFLVSHDTEAIEGFLSLFKTVFPDEPSLATYARLYGDLKRRNKLIGPHDLWIATAALTQGLPLLTRNAEEFSAIPGLQVLNYANT